MGPGGTAQNKGEDRQSWSPMCSPLAEEGVLQPLYTCHGTRVPLSPNTYKQIYFLCLVCWFIDIFKHFNVIFYSVICSYLPLCPNSSLYLLSPSPHPVRFVSADYSWAWRLPRSVVNIAGVSTEELTPSPRSSQVLVAPPTRRGTSCPPPPCWDLVSVILNIQEKGWQ